MLQSILAEGNRRSAKSIVDDAQESIDVLRGVLGAEYQ
jgi:hypothetical protein